MNRNGTIADGRAGDRQEGKTVMFKLAIGLLVATFVLYGVSRMAAKSFGQEVAARFLELGPTSRAYTADSLARWVEANRRDAHRYAVPVLFPVDLLFMACLAAFLAFASVALGAGTGRLAGVLWLFTLLPAAYLAVDLAEDTMLACFLLSPHRITPALVKAAHVLTTLKIATLGVSVAQFGILGVLALVWRR